MTEDEFVAYLSERGISSEVANVVFAYYSELVGGRGKIAPSETREALAGAGVEDCLDDARLILRRLSHRLTFDELAALQESMGFHVATLEEIARLVQRAMERSGQNSEID